MSQEPKRKFANQNYSVPVVLAVCCAIVVGAYLAGRASDKSVTPTEVAPSDEVVNSAATGPVNSPDSLGSRERGSVRLLASDADAEASSSRLSSPDDPVDYAHYDVPGFSVEEVKLLHARQEYEMKQMLGDLDAAVIESDNGDGTGITVRELRSMHEQQQERNLTSAFEGEVVIPAGVDNISALTVADLRAMHEKQEKEVKALASPDEIAIAGSVDGTGDLTKAEIAALHERERIALANGSRTDYPAPVPEAGSPHLTVEEVRNLHQSQFRD